jgi:hypothetical protein
MSKLSGDKARFHRIRKQNIVRRRKIWELRQKLAVAPALDTSKSKPSEV